MFYFLNFIMFSTSTSNLHCGVVSLFIFLEKTKQSQQMRFALAKTSLEKIVVALESLRFQGRSPRQAHIRVINGKRDYLLCK